MGLISQMLNVYFAAQLLRSKDDRYAYGEQRFITIGMLDLIIVVIAHTEHNHSVRVISMRKATKYEETLYFKEIFY